MGFTRRHKAALDALRGGKELRLYDLPDFIGEGTMADLVEARLIRVVHCTETRLVTWALVDARED